MTRHLIAILRGIKPDEALEIGTCLVELGFSKIEVPLNSPNPFESIKILSDNLSSKAAIGAGTVLSAEDVDKVKQAGGTLIVSPDCNEDVIKQTIAHRMESWPGIATATEAFAALRYGATGLKLFPGSVLGPSGLKALRAVLPQETMVFPVGGAAPSNFAEWLSAGASGFGIGSALYRPDDSLETVKANAESIIKAYDDAYDKVLN